MAINYALEGPKWGSSALGTPGGVVTWSYSTAFTTSFQSEIQAAFAAWSAVANITFTYVADAALAQIDLGWAAIDGVANILGQANYWYSGANFLHADITFDSAEPWTASANGLVAFGSAYFATLALHEIGHAIGLDHYSGSVAIMNPYLPNNLRSLTTSDIDGATALYGAAPAAMTSSPLRFAGTGDFNHDGVSDVLLRNATTGSVGYLDTGTGHTIGNIPGGYKIAGTGDFDHDGTTDVLFESNAGGFFAEWIMDNGHVRVEGGVGYKPGGSTVAGTGDFNHDGTSDILFQNPSIGLIALWQMNNGHVAVEAGMGFAPDGFRFAATSDFNGDGTSDVLFQNAASGAMALWQVADRHIAIEAGLGTAPSGFHFLATGDFNHDGTTDVLFQNASGFVAEWVVNNGHVTTELGLGVAPSGFSFAGVADVNHDGTHDILFQNASGAVQSWQMQNTHVMAQLGVDWIVA